MKQKNILTIHFCLFLYLIMSTIVISYLKQSTIIVHYTQILLFIVFFHILASQIKLNGLMHLFTIFLGLFFLFLLGLPFFDLINLVDINEEYLFRFAKLSNAIYIKVYTYASFFLMIIFFGVLFGYKSENNIKNKKEVNYSLYLWQVGFFLLLLALPGILTKYYIQLQVVFEKGYLAIYDGTLNKIDYPLICSGSGTLLTIGYCIAISSKPNKKQFLLITTIFLLTQVMNVLKGQRAVLMFPFVFVIWFYFNFYIKTVSKKRIIIIILCVVVFSQAISMFRINHYDENKSFVQQYISEFFVQQGVSFFILPYMLHYKLKNEKYPYILAPLDITSFGKPQSMERLQKHNYLPDQLMYKMLPESYSQGVGVGSSILGVFYDLPNIVAIFLCFTLGFLIARFEIFFKNYRLLLLFSYFIVISVISSLRFELFQLFYDAIMLFIIFSVAIILHGIITIISKKDEKSIVH